MSEDAIYILDLFNLQLGALQHEMYEVKMKWDRFDRFSYSAWAITETLKAVADYSGYVTVGLVREILKMQLDDYTTYYERNPVRHGKYKHASDTISYLLDLTGGYVNDEQSI